MRIDSRELHLCKEDEKYELHNIEYMHNDHCFGVEPICVRLEYGDERLARAILVAEESLEHLKSLEQELGLILHLLPPQIQFILGFRLDLIKQTIKKSEK